MRIVKKSSKGLILIIIGVFIGIFLSAERMNKQVNKLLLKNQAHEVRATGYRYISPLLECEYNSFISAINGLDPLHDDIARFIDDKKHDNTIDQASVYFRDLNNGPWFGIDEHVLFTPASLLKLPVMMAYFKKAESDSLLLGKKIRYDKKFETLPQSYSTPSVTSGKDYTTEELIEHMIIYSDNDALTLLEKNIENDLIDRITQDLNVETEKGSSDEDFMSVKGYASLFRILYNASYLNKEYSEKALSILSNVQFKKGLVAGVPANITVAHKYGERGTSDKIQLHDCGIVYYPKHPYLLCIMTRGFDYETLSGTIQNISKQIYQGIDSRYKKNS